MKLNLLTEVRFLFFSCTTHLSAVNGSAEVAATKSSLSWKTNMCEVILDEKSERIFTANELPWSIFGQMVTNIRRVQLVDRAEGWHMKLVRVGHVITKRFKEVLQPYKHIVLHACPGCILILKQR